MAIIGAGPAGLPDAYHLHRDYLILESQDEIGGLCRSFEMAQTTFDLGGHAFFTKHDYVRKLLFELCGNHIFNQPRGAWVYSHGAYVPYPFQANPFGLPPDVVAECLIGLVEALKFRTENPCQQSL